MSKKIIVIISVLSIVMTMVFLPISSSAETVPSNFYSYTMTPADWIYLFDNNYLNFQLSISSSTITTIVDNDGWNIANNWGVTFYSDLYPVSGTFNLSIFFNLPFRFALGGGTFRFSQNLYGSGVYPHFLDGDISYDSYSSGNSSSSSYDIGSDLWGSKGYSFSVISSIKTDFLFDCITFPSISTAPSSNKVASFVSFQDIVLKLSQSDYDKIINQGSWGSDPGGDPSDPGGDPSDPGGSGSVDFTPLIGYLESLNSENQSTVDTIQSKTDTAIEGLSSSSEQAMDFFNESESLKTDIIGSIEDYDSFLDSLDLSEEISVSYDGDSYTFDPIQGLVLIGGRIKSLFSFPLFYFIIFMLFFLALASYVIYGRA